MPRNMSFAATTQQILRGIVADLAASNPIDLDGEMLDEWCHFCEEPPKSNHAESCVWRRAVEVTGGDQ